MSRDERGHFVKCAMHSDERIRTALCSSISWAVDGLRASFRVWVVTSRVSSSFWVLDTAQVVVLEVTVAGVAIGDTGGSLADAR